MHSSSPIKGIHRKHDGVVREVRAQNFLQAEQDVVIINKQKPMASAHLTAAQKEAIQLVHTVNAVLTASSSRSSLLAHSILSSYQFITPTT